MILFIKNLEIYVEQQQVDNLYITEFMSHKQLFAERNRYFMKQEYKLKEVFDEKSKTLDEKLIEVFINFLIEKVNK